MQFISARLYVFSSFTGLRTELAELSSPDKVTNHLFLFCHQVHNWTVEDTVQWLKEAVELPQYEKNFRDFQVTGNTLPRLVWLTSC